MSSEYQPATPIPQPKGGINEQALMDFAAALTITLPKNISLNKIKVYINATGEPAEGFIGKQLVKHCKEWTTAKTIQEILKKLQGLLHLRIIFTAATQSKEPKWTIFQNSEEYLYGLNESKININKCPSRGVDYVDKKCWNKATKNEDLRTALNNNTKMIGMTPTSTAQVQVTFTTMAKKVMGTNALPKSKPQIITSNKMVKVKEKKYKGGLFTKSQIDQAQKQYNDEMKELGHHAWSWKGNVKKKEKEKEKEKEKTERKENKKRTGSSGSMGRGGNDGVKTKYAYFDDEDSKYYVGKSATPKTAKNTLIEYDAGNGDGDGDDVVEGSDDINNYEKEMIVNVWSQGKKKWVDGEVLEVIKFLKTLKVKFDGKTQQFRVPNINMVRLKH